MRLIALCLVAACALAAPSAAPAAAVAGPANPGIQLGPAPTPTAPTPAGGSVPGDRASSAAFWDLPGRVREAINDWFRGLVLDALSPSLELVGGSVLSTPTLGSNGEVAALWQVSLLAADGLLVLCLLVAAGVAMSHETMQSRYALKDLLRRLAFAGVAINASLSVVDQFGAVANGLSAAFLGDGANAAAASASLENVAAGALDGGGIFLILLGLACAVAAVSLLVTYLVRVALVVVLACAAPLVLLGHLFPQTEGVAALWWRALGAAFAVQVSQALLLAASVRVFFAGGAAGLGLPSSGSVVDLLLCLCLLLILVRIPFWAKELAFGSRGSTTLRLARTYAVARVGRAVI